MYYIQSRPVTDATIINASVPEDPTAAWAAGTYAVGDERHLLSTHMVYRCAAAGASSLPPDQDSARWTEMRPTNKWAPFDIYTKITKAVSTTADLVFEVRARFASTLILDGLEGRGVIVEQLDAPGGSVVFRHPATGEVSLTSSARGYWDYAYGQRSRIESMVVTGLVFSATSVLRITVTAPAGQRRAVGLINWGALRQVHGSKFGGVSVGASAAPVTNTYWPKRTDGTYGPVVLRPGSKERSWRVIFEKERANEAFRIMQQLSDQPAYIMATLRPGYEWLRGFGLISRGPVTDQGGYSECNVEIKDIV